MLYSSLFENGEVKFLPAKGCKVDANDAGANFGDGVYEVIAVTNNNFVDLSAHMSRLKTSLEGVEITLPTNFGLSQIEQALERLLKENNIKSEGYVYFRITRGTSVERDFKITETTPNFYAEWHDVKLFKTQSPNQGETALIVPDTRWFFKNLKTLQLMPSRLAKRAGEKVGADDVIFINDKSIILEGGSTNLFIIKNREIFTHPADNAILAGITRMRLIELAQKNGYKAYEKKFSLDDMLSADEVFRSSTSIGARGISKIIIKQSDAKFLSDEIDLWQPSKNQIGDYKIANGSVGPITLELAAKYANYARNNQQNGSHEAA